MHIHILGICGTFMGGLAALAREAGHKVTGCDANVYPPMSDQLRALGIDLIEGFARPAGAAPDMFVVGNVVTRGNPLMEAILDAGAAYTSGPQWLAEHVLQGRMCWRWPAPTARPPPPRCWPGSWSRPGCSRASWSAACR
jgi:UDP-N-acetylmuramate: L-alanyl-gamma-D-glutamyl-meso-diaminopimelate ligase